MAGNVRSLVANHITTLKKKYLKDLLGNSEIRRQPIGNHVRGGNSSNGKEMRTGVPVTM